MSQMTVFTLPPGYSPAGTMPDHVEVRAGAVVDVDQAAAERPPKPGILAHIKQEDPAYGGRAWRLVVFDWRWDADRAVWTHDTGCTREGRLTQSGIRPPTKQQRAEGLARLGYVLAHPEDPYAWTWDEGEFPGSGKPYIFAATTVLPTEEGSLT